MQDNYIQSRSTAIESIETTIAELGQIFNQLAHMVAEQRETVQRIDADTLDIASNVGGAQRELLKYYASISSNRWLMLKVFGVLIVFVRSYGFLEGPLLTAVFPVFTLYLSIMTDIIQPWLCLAVVVHVHIHAHRRYAPLWAMDYHQIRMHIPRICYPIGSALTPVPKFLVRAPRFFPAFFPPRCAPTWFSSLTVQVRFVRGTSPSPDVFEKRCGCNVSCRAVSIPTAAAVLRVRRV
jgi:hypothetical protein